MLKSKNFLKAGVMGFPIKHSLSPLMHNYWFREKNINGSYVPILTKPADLEIALGSLQSLGFSGCNLTIPLKEIALKAISKKTGARGLRSILENILLKTMYDLPSKDNIEEVIIDASAVKGQSQPIIVHSKTDNKAKTDKTSAA